MHNNTLPIKCPVIPRGESSEEHAIRDSLTRRASRFLALLGMTTGCIVAIASPVLVQSVRTYKLDPFERATAGYVGCPEVPAPVVTEEEMRVQAHERAERGTSCCLAGTCECGGAYRRDPEINARVATAIATDPRFRDSSVWVTTTRKFVTLQGCVRSARQKQWLEQLVKKQADVAIVWNETTVGTAPRKR